VLPRVDKPPKTPTPAHDSAQDALLLQQVNDRIARTAPLAMEPLLIWMDDENPMKDGIGEEQ
jgi:hypothetical protein